MLFWATFDQIKGFQHVGVNNLIENFNLSEPPHWSSQTLVTALLVIQPSSVFAERAFSFLTNALDSQQDRALEDYLEASFMLRFNNRKEL